MCRWWTDGFKTILNGLRCALTIFSGKIIYSLPIGKICGFSRLAFSREGRRGKQHLSIGFLRKTAFSPLTEAAVSGINKNDKGE